MMTDYFPSIATFSDEELLHRYKIVFAKLVNSDIRHSLDRQEIAEFEGAYTELITEIAKRGLSPFGIEIEQLTTQPDQTDEN